MRKWPPTAPVLPRDDPWEILPLQNDAGIVREWQHWLVQLGWAHPIDCVHVERWLLHCLSITNRIKSVNACEGCRGRYVGDLPVSRVGRVGVEARLSCRGVLVVVVVVELEREFRDGDGSVWSTA